MKDKNIRLDNFNEANLEDIKESLKSEDPLALNNGKAFRLVCVHTGPCKVTITKKSCEICAEMLLD